MRLTPRNVDVKLTRLLEDYAEEYNLWFGRIKIENADIPRRVLRNKEGFLVSLYVGGDVEENPNFLQYVAIRHEILLGYNIPASDRDNSITREMLWQSAESLKEKLSKDGFMIAFGPEDIPATDIRMTLFCTYTRGTISAFG